jgi:hypothetical protein
MEHLSLHDAVQSQAEPKLDYRQQSEHSPMFTLTHGIHISTAVHTAMSKSALFYMKRSGSSKLKMKNHGITLPNSILQLLHGFKVKGM